MGQAQEGQLLPPSPGASGTLAGASGTLAGSAGATSGLAFATPGLVGTGGGSTTPLLIVPTTWEHIVAMLKLESHEIAYALAMDVASVPWTDAFGPLRKITAAGIAGTDLAHIVRSYVDSLDPIFLLVVVDNAVKVLYGLKPCHATSGNGQRFLGLIGEREIRAGQEVHPKLHTLGGNLNKQVDHFAAVDIAAPTMADIETTFQGDATLTMVTALTADPVTHVAAPTISSWMALPVHPKLACLFLKGMSVRNAFFLAKQIISIIPPSLAVDLVPFVNFIRSAVTKATNGTSSLTSGWKREAHTSTDQLESWYYELVSRNAPKYVSPTVLPVPALPVPAQQVITNQATTASDRVLQELSAHLRGEQRTSKPYHTTELHVLFSVCGVERPWAGLTDASLPPFWLELKDFRKANSNARLFIENFRQVNYPPQRFVFPFLFTPQLIKDLKGLSFAGNDPLILYKMRHTGISIFSLAPLSESSTTLGARDTFLHYEETMSHHGPVDRAAMESLSMVAQAIPSDRMSLYHWIDSFHIGIEIFFGYMCPLCSLCSDLLELFRNPVHFTGYTIADFRVVLWMIHRAIRLFFLNLQTLPLARLIADLAGGMRPALNNLPIELRGPMTTSDDGSTNYSGSTMPPPPPAQHMNPSHLSSPTKRQKMVESAPYASRFQSDMKRAVTHWNKNKKGLGEFRISRLCNPSQMTEIFGSEFLSLAPATKPPCFRYHISGLCSGSRAGPCDLTHTLHGEPSTTVLDGIQRRLETRVNQFLLVPPKV